MEETYSWRYTGCIWEKEQLPEMLSPHAEGDQEEADLSVSARLL